MKMPCTSHKSLLQSLSDDRNRSTTGILISDKDSVALSDLLGGSALGGRGGELRGQSVLIATTGQLTAALALIELDGVARRLVLCPPDLPLEHIPSVIEAAGIEAIVSDGDRLGPTIPAVKTLVTCSPSLTPAKHDLEAACETEWILLTSGTTGRPKLVVHTLETLTGAIQPVQSRAESTVWSTFYDIRRYGGLQIFLRAVLSVSSLVLSSVHESTADFLARAGAHGVTHISGTPSHWRKALMSPAVNLISPKYVRLSGEIADQAILNHLRAAYPEAKVAHAFASTEAGVAFDVTDGLAGFPATLIGQKSGVEMLVEDGSLRIRSTRNADRYLNRDVDRLRSADGFVDTGDMVELRNDRYYFVGRRDGVINVGGSKIHPEEVEAVINRHPQVRMSLVHKRKNSITGAIIVADVVLETPSGGAQDQRELQKDILQFCREALPATKVPALIRFVPNLEVAESGKLRRYA